jgi:hypothetical protein
MTQPVRRSGDRHSCPDRRLLDEPVDLHGGEMSALARPVALTGIASKRGQLSPDARREQHDPRLATLAGNGDLAGILARLEVAPGKRVELRDAQRAGV